MYLDLLWSSCLASCFGEFRWTSLQTYTLQTQRLLTQVISLSLISSSTPHCCIPPSHRAERSIRTIDSPSLALPYLCRYLCILLPQQESCPVGAFFTEITHRCFFSFSLKMVPGFPGIESKPWVKATVCCDDTWTEFCCSLWLQ